MKDILQKVDVERLYNHVLSIEGIRHPLIDPDKLNETADYIKSEFQSYGLTASEQTFEMKGYDITFRNIEAHIGDDTKPEILVTSHYDTVQNAPGADDNGSAVAGMLEVARVLAEEKHTGNVRFISFTLEELNPSLAKDFWNKGFELGIFDEDFNYVSYHSLKMIRKFLNNSYLRISKGQPIYDAWINSFKEIEKDLTTSEKEFCQYIVETRRNITRSSWLGQLGLVGSDHWVKNALQNGKQIRGVINLESIGYTSKRKNSQFLPPLMHPLLFPSYKVKARKRIGNYIAVTSDKNSKQLGKVFCKSCKHEAIKLPYLWAKLPLRYEKIAKWLYDTLRADHAPFWRENIPALMITDTANFRNPYYHTEADTIDKLDFDFVKKVTQATLATAIEFQVE